MANINQLPYYLINNTYKTNQIAKFLLKKVKKLLKEKCPYHYLVFQRKDKMLKIIQDKSKKYPYFLRFDIEKYYPSINHEILLDILRKILKSRQGQKLLKTEILPFLNKIGIQNKGLPLGNYLSYVLAGIYLLPLDIKLIKLNKPFLRVQDDYLVFCKNKKEPERILKEIIEPELNKLELKININKLNSGKFHQNPVEFMGFKYYAGVFTISKQKIEEFKKKIVFLTHLNSSKQHKIIKLSNNKNKNDNSHLFSAIAGNKWKKGNSGKEKIKIKATIKKLNNKILGFGHYYKLASCKQDFEKLDAFIRQRLRRYISRNKDSKNRLGNLILTNEAIKSMGLKSLTDIYTKYATKNGHILRKTNKKKRKIGNEKKSDFLRKSDFLTDNYYEKAMLQQLQELTKNINCLKKKIEKIEKKWKINE